MAPMASVDLPEPDSPTRPKLSCSCTLRETSRTARSTPASVSYSTHRPSTSKTGRRVAGAVAESGAVSRPAAGAAATEPEMAAVGSLFTSVPRDARQHDLPQAVGHEAGGDHQERDGSGREEQRPRGEREEVARFVDLQPPVGRGRLHPQAQEAQGGDPVSY